MARPVFYPYKLGSASAKVLAQAFSSERVRPNGEFRNNFKRPVINWGNSQRPTWMTRWPDQVILNKPEAVAIAANKLRTFEKFSEHGVPCPEWTTSREAAIEWYNTGEWVVARKTLTGKSGEGISLHNNEHSDLNQYETQPVSAPLYTKYFKKKHEYRVHVVRGKVVDFVMKKKRAGVEGVDTRIRNLDNGWVFCRDGITLPASVAEAAVKAVSALGLDFGAVDIGHNVHYDRPAVFEVNTAPGIEGTTVASYAAAFKEIL